MQKWTQGAVNSDQDLEAILASGADNTEDVLSLIKN